MSQLDLFGALTQTTKAHPPLQHPRFRCDGAVSSGLSCAVVACRNETSFAEAGGDTDAPALLSARFCFDHDTEEIKAMKNPTKFYLPDGTPIVLPTRSWGIQ